VVVVAVAVAIATAATAGKRTDSGENPGDGSVVPAAT
jgi:hypothetical protein